jgi:hypothetical protein
MDDANPKMFDATNCPQCGAPLKNPALGGLCPACLLAQGANDTVTDAKEPTILQKEEHSGSDTLSLPENFVPLTLAFETRDGTRGLLQITKFEDNPQALKIRYKLLKKMPRRTLL